jgi:poly(3-hydroxybutyrate) depolymerase
MPLRRLPAVLALAVLALGVAPARAQLAPGDYERTLSFGGLQRSYLVHVPPGWLE